VTGARDGDATRIALSLLRADWQDDEESWNQLWALAEDPGQVARELTRLCRETLDQIASVAGVSTAEMLHRMAAQLIPHPEPGHISLVDLEHGETGVRGSSGR
jgi:hypothetical protein